MNDRHVCLGQSPAGTEECHVLHVHLSMCTHTAFQACLKSIHKCAVLQLVTQQLQQNYTNASVHVSIHSYTVPMKESETLFIQHNFLSAFCTETRKDGHVSCICRVVGQLLQQAIHQEWDVSSTKAFASCLSSRWKLLRPNHPIPDWLHATSLAIKVHSFSLIL